MDSYIVRVYRRAGGAVVGTVQPVAGGPALGFGSATELQQRLARPPQSGLERGACGAKSPYALVPHHHPDPDPP